MTWQDMYDVLSQQDKDLLNSFWSEVERRAELKMIKTGKLEGAHYNAAKEVMNEIRNKEEHD